MCFTNCSWSVFLPILFCISGHVSAHLCKMVEFFMACKCLAVGGALSWFVIWTAIVALFYGFSGFCLTVSLFVFYMHFTMSNSCLLYDGCHRFLWSLSFDSFCPYQNLFTFTSLVFFIALGSFVISDVIALSLMPLMNCIMHSTLAFSCFNS